MADPAVERLLASPEPSVRYLTLVDVLGESPRGAAARRARAAIADSPRVGALSRDYGGHTYGKWRGAFWRLNSLVELGVPARHEGARRAADAALGWLDTPAHRRRPTIAGRERRCACQEGYGLANAVRLGLSADPRVARLVETLLAAQWPDGGWNCDRRPEAVNSSFNETAVPLWGLAEWARATGDERARAAADRAAELLLRHRVHRDLERWRRLRWPHYWHYDLLQGLTVLARSVGLDDPRSAEALDLLERQRLPDGAWRPDGRWWKPPGAKGGGVECVEWRGEHLTLQALRVLAAARRL